MDHAWYGPLTPAGLLTGEDDARTHDGPFEPSITSGSLTVEFDDLRRKGEAREVGLGYVAELAMRRGRRLTWAPTFRTPGPAGTVHEASFDASARFSSMLGKVVTRADGTVEVVRPDSIDAFHAEACIRANENLREIRRNLAASGHVQVDAARAGPPPIAHC